MPKRELRINETIKKKAIFPYLKIFIYSIIVFVGGPISVNVLISSSVSASPHLMTAFWGSIVMLCAWLMFIMPHFKRSICLLSDMLFDNFVTCKIRYQDTLINRYYYFPDEGIIFANKNMEPETFLQVYCEKENNEQLILSSARYHGMISGEIYGVIYGKHSKIIKSILPINDEEVWNITFAEWISKRDEIFPKSNMTYKQLKEYGDDIEGEV